jgi:NADH dehydrogenase FAD-containing subunit
VTDEAEDTVGYMAKLRSKQQVIAQAQSILIVGGGPVGVELAGNRSQAFPKQWWYSYKGRN